MKPKFNVANHLNDYLKKGVLVIVVFMLLTIPNMNVYSFIGRYQNSSPAITANNNYKVSYGVEKPVFAGIIVGGVVALVSLLAIDAAVSVASLILVSTSAAGADSIFANPTSMHNHFDENYAPYDFSQFDN